MRNRIINKMRSDLLGFQNLIGLITGKANLSGLKDLIGYRIRNFSTFIMVIAATMFIVSSCDEGKRFEISGDDTTPPAPPVFIKSDPLPGGARIYFTPPADRDVLSIEASYVNAAGKTLRFAESFVAPSLDVYGFGREGEHAIELYAVDRAGNRSTNVKATVTSLEPPAATVAKSVDVLPSFASMLLKWVNVSSTPLYVWVDFSYTQNGVRHDHTTIFNTLQTETRSVDSLKLFAGEPVSVKVSVRDKFDNMVQAKETTIVLLTDEVIVKDGWSIPKAGTVMGGVTQVGGLHLEAAIDGIIEIDVENYFITTQANPWSLIIDLGEEYELSRIVTHQRWSGYFTDLGELDVRGNLYRGDNVLSFNLHGWDETAKRWDWMSFHSIDAPIVKSEDEYTTLRKRGDMSFIFSEEPQFSKPTRYVRFEAVNGKYISEITLYGRKAR